jgi:hypothetical protein
VPTWSASTLASSCGQPGPTLPVGPSAISRGRKHLLLATGETLMATLWGSVKEKLGVVLETNRGLSCHAPQRSNRRFREGRNQQRRPTTPFQALIAELVGCNRVPGCSDSDWSFRGIVMTFSVSRLACSAGVRPPEKHPRGTPGLRAPQGRRAEWRHYDLNSKRPGCWRPPSRNAAPNRLGHAVPRPEISVTH